MLNFIADYKIDINAKNNKNLSALQEAVLSAKNDKIIKSFTFYNEADVLEQMGYLFINPNDL